MQIQITQQDIDKCISGRIGWSNPCPITMVLRKHYPGKYIVVNGMHILTGEKYEVSKELGKFIVDWDRRREVNPIIFHLSLLKEEKRKYPIY